MFDDRSFGSVSFDSRSWAGIGGVPPAPTFGGAGYPVTGIYWGVRKINRGKKLDDILKKAMEQIVNGDLELEPETTAAKAIKVVKPYIVKSDAEAIAPEIDWKAVESDIAKVKELLRLWEEQVRIQDDEDILLLSEW